MVSDAGGPSTVTELARRLLRVESLLDERIVTRDMLMATEKLLEARDVAHGAVAQTLEKRVERLEGASSRLTYLLVASFLGMIVSILAQIVNSGGSP
jgi:hypothetical protein